MNLAFESFVFESRKKKSMSKF